MQQPLVGIAQALEFLTEANYLKKIAAWFQGKCPEDEFVYELA